MSHHAENTHGTHGQSDNDAQAHRAATERFAQACGVAPSHHHSSDTLLREALIARGHDVAHTTGTGGLLAIVLDYAATQIEAEATVAEE